jgi:hypothetical protein
MTINLNIEVTTTRPPAIESEKLRHLLGAINKRFNDFQKSTKHQETKNMLVKEWEEVLNGEKVQILYLSKML